jgi:hypothetical protein
MWSGNQTRGLVKGTDIPSHKTAYFSGTGIPKKLER